jgi:hypothetical protein
MLRKSLFGWACAMVATLAGALAAADTPATPKTAPTPTMQPNQPPQNIGGPTGPVTITKVVGTTEAVSLSRYIHVTVENFGTTDADVVLTEARKKFGCNKIDGKEVCNELNQALKVKARDKVTQKIYDPSKSLCKEGAGSFHFKLTGTKADDRVRIATRPPPTFTVGEIRIGDTGVPPTDEVNAKHVRLTSVKVDGGYACDKKLKVQAEIKNGSGIKPTQLKLVLLDQPLYGTSAHMGGDQVKIGESLIGIAGLGSVTALVTSDDPVSGRDGEVDVKLADTGNELGNKLSSYNRWGQIQILAAAGGQWKLE